ncbi:MFS transporter [Pseudahrensia aquimaris]|uniref:MFS transporter n=1 Tax=Pseudahrensia aquimaris TaxID=744461 RepID=A0ABW3FCB4_9HYPH
MARQIIPILALLIGMVFLMLGSGLHGLLIPIRGGLENMTAFDLGWIGTGYAIGFTLGCVLVPRLVRRVGHVRTFSTMTAIMSVSMLLNGMYVDVILWTALRAINGFCIAGCYMVAESWLNERVTNEYRGSMFSIYAITTMVAMMAGQYVLVLGDAGEEFLFMLGAILYALAVVPTATSKAQSPAPLNNVSIDLPALFRNSPASFIGAILSGVISSAWTNFGPVFGQQSAMSSAEIATLLAAAMMGSILFQYPLGKLSDMIDRRYVMAIAGLIGIATGTLMTSLSRDGSHDFLFFAATLAYGGVIYSIYSLVVAHANDHAETGEFVKVSSGLLILYGFGTMVGPLITASMMDTFGPSGVFATTTAAHLAFASWAIYRTFRREQVAEEERVDFQGMSAARAQTPETYVLDPRSDETYGQEDEPEAPPMPAPVKVEL